jgi:small ligand-binding sensory domain FIST
MNRRVLQWMLPWLALSGGTALLVPPSIVRSGQQRQRPTRSVLFQSTWQSHLSIHPDATDALQELLTHVNPSKTTTPDLAFLFVAQFHAPQFETLVQQAADALPKSTRLVSVVGGGVVGDAVEIDEPSQPGLSLLIGSLPKGLDDVELFYFNELSRPPPSDDSKDWSNLLYGIHDNGEHDSAARSASVLLFADPWSPLEQVTRALDSAGNSRTLSVTIAGGITVPSGTGPTLAIGGSLQPQGSLIGVCFRAQSLTQLQVVVAQGCRPVGPTYAITAAVGNVALELDSKPAMRALEDFLHSITSIEEQKVISSGLLCGIRSTLSLENTNSDDYLVRQLLGFVPSKGGIAVAAGLRVGDKLRFHVRDKSAALQDLELMVQRAQTERLFASRNDQGGATMATKPMCALQISCVARGQSFFGVPNADLSRVKALLSSPDGAVAGFFANGEIGPVGLAGFTTSKEGGGTFLHGFTTVIAMLVDMSTTGNSEEDVNWNRMGEQSDVWG